VICQALFAEFLVTGESLIATKTLREAPTPPIAALQPLDAAPLRRRGCRLALGGVGASSSDISQESIHN